MDGHYDVIIIGTGAGGGTLSRKLAPSGKNILILERGDFVKREPDNWNSRAVNVEGKYNTKEVWYDRDGKPLQIAAVLREQPKQIDGAGLDPRLAGASFAELPESLRRQNATGVLVDEVARGSRAARNGLRKGDVIRAASIGEFADLGGFRAGFSERPVELVLVVWRNGQQGQLLMQ